MKSDFPDILDYNSINWISYKNNSGKSGVKNFCTQPDSIWVEFKDSIYLYNTEITGNVVNRMIATAPTGEKLSTYINQIGGDRKKYVVKYTLVDGVWKKAK
jgi:hypothetical protein